MTQEPKITPCPACGGEHDLGPMGLPNTVFAGIPIAVCPNLPPDHMWVEGTGLVRLGSE